MCMKITLTIRTKLPPQINRFHHLPIIKDKQRNKNENNNLRYRMILVDSPFPDAGVDQWSLKTRVGSNDEDEIRFFNVGNGGIHQVVRPEVDTVEMKRKKY